MSIRETAQADLSPAPSYYIDTETGAWGDASKIVFITGDLPEHIREGSDNEITNFGTEYGTPLDRLI